MPTDVNNKAVGINAYDIVKGLEVFIIGIICAYLLIRCIKSQKDAKKTDYLNKFNKNYISQIMLQSPNR